MKFSAFRSPVVEVIELVVPLEDAVDVVSHDPDHLLHLHEDVEHLDLDLLPHLGLGALQLPVVRHGAAAAGLHCRELLSTISPELLALITEAAPESHRLPYYQQQ